jgi:hypothetical protein
MPAVNDKIDVDYYNDLQTKIQRVLNDGLSDGLLYLGYGQPTRSDQVTTSDKITVEQYSDLRYDIWNSYNHLYNTIPSGATEVNVNLVTQSNVITYQSPASTVSNTVPVDKWASFVNTIYSNARNLAVAGQRRTVNHGTQSHVWPSATYGDDWSDAVTCTITVTFPSTDAARYFFNSGSSVDITSTRSGGTSNNQNTSWTNILTTVGTQKFSGAYPNTTGVGPTFDGSNFYKCTSIFTQPFVNVAGSSPYSLNRYKIWARTPNHANPHLTGADVIEFLVEFIDDHEEQGGPPVSGPSNPGDGGFGPDFVDGQITVSCQTTEATGSLQPSGSFDIATPSVVIGPVQEVS